MVSIYLMKFIIKKIKRYNLNLCETFITKSMYSKSIKKTDKKIKKKIVINEINFSIRLKLKIFFWLFVFNPKKLNLKKSPAFAGKIRLYV